VEIHAISERIWHMRYLRYMREQKGLTQDQLSELSGVGQHGISEVERGLRKPNAKTLSKLAKALDVKEPSMLALSVSSGKTFEEVVNGDKGTREAFLEYKNATGRLASLVADLESIFEAALEDGREESLTRARLHVAFMLGYSKCAIEGVGVELRDAEEEEQKRGALAVKS
jgi:transcriptional regulator with XRE-family HTH domain